MKKVLWLVVECLIAAGLIGGAVWYFHYGKSAGEQARGRKTAVPVVITKEISKKTVPVEIESLGNTIANESIVLTATTQEIVKEICFEEGQFVKKGQVLIRLEANQEEAEKNLTKLAERDAVLAKQEAELTLQDTRHALKTAEQKQKEAQLRLDEAELDLKEAEREKERLEGLYLDSAISEKDFDIQNTQYDRAVIQRNSAKAQLETAKTEVESAKTAVEKAVKNVEKAENDIKVAKEEIEKADTAVTDRTVKAPFDGIIGERKVSLGALISPGTPIATLDDITKIKVKFNVPEKHLAVLSCGQKFYAESVAYPGERFEGTIQLIDTHLNSTTRSVQIRGIITNKKSGKEEWMLKSGMLLYLTIELGNTDQIVVPEKAVQSLGEIHYIYIYDPATKKVERREVTTGSRADGNVVLLSGAKDGEIYVDEGISKLSDGATVQLAGE